MLLEQLLTNQNFLFLILAWTLPWKGVALWKASKNSQKGWFVALLILNTLAILEIIYIFYFSKKQELKQV
jgi:methionyl-tRNA synthetase